ncbi:MAG: serine hydrolase domain-containing protein [Candidatus Binatia bacterium]
MDFSRAATAIEQAITTGAFPGAVLLVGRGDEILYHEAFGQRSLEPTRTPMTRDIVFDLSSLTKALATTTAIMLLVREGKIRLDDRVSRFIPNFGVHGKIHVAIHHLLGHCSGLPAWRPFFKEVQRAERQGKFKFSGRRGARAMVLDEIHRERPEYETGTKAVYSDLGFLLLGELVELVSHQPLDRFCRERIFKPMHLRSTAFIDLDRMRAQKLSPVTDMIAPTERCAWRQKVVCGEVHDDNAWAIGGVAGHAGLFASAEDVHRIVARLATCAADQDPFLPGGLVREFWRREGSVPESTWALGWDTPLPTGSMAGSRASASTVGHLGFTGTSVWLDRERGAHVVFLTNRVHPRRDNERIKAVRPQVHDAVWEALDA